MLSLLAVVAVLATLVAFGAFIATRMRSGEAMPLSFRTILLVYLYLMCVASFLVFTAGLSVGTKALLSNPFGREFSYHTYVPPAFPAPVDGAKTTPPEVRDEQVNRSTREAERQYKNDLIQGATLTILGGLIWGLHWYARRRMQSAADPSSQFFNKAYSAILLAIFGIAGIVSLTTGVYDVLRYALLESDEFSGRNPPGSSIASAIVFVPCWFYYLTAVMSHSRQEQATRSTEA